MVKRMIYHWLCLRYICYVDDPEFFLVTSVSVQVFTLNVFSIRYVCYADFSSLSMYFPFVTFVTLISTGTTKTLFLSFHIVKWLKGWFIIDSAFVTFGFSSSHHSHCIFHSLRFVTLISHHSQCIFHSLHSLRWFPQGPEKSCFLRFIL